MSGMGLGKENRLISRMLAFGSQRMVVVLEVFPDIREMYRHPLNNNDMTSLPSISWGRGITSKKERILLAIAKGNFL